MNNTLSESCPLCQSADTKFYLKDKKREYLVCQICHLVYVPKIYHLTIDAEKDQYDLHQNNPLDFGYRQFLSRLTQPLIQQLKKGDQGLDFGSGPGPTLSLMLSESGFNMSIYDKFYAPNLEVFTQQYDFITATEVIEHLHDPQRELEQLFAHLKVAGKLAIMTKMCINQTRFEQWHYKNDPTHICFFSKNTFNWLAKHWQAKLEFFATDVIIFTKSR